ncbi:MAG: LysR family transcriptional regulator [Saccharospirillum sp.]
MNWAHLHFDWNQAKAFYIVASEGSFSAAARSLGLTQPTLGRQVRALEEALNVTLFERGGRGLTLTESGKILFEQVQQMGDAANAFSLAATGRTQLTEGDVSVSVTELDAVYRMPEALAALQRTAPKIRIELVVSNEISDLKKREADLAIRYKRPEQGDLILRKIDTERVYLYGQADFVARTRHQHPNTVPDLKLLGFDKTAPFLRYFQQHGWAVQDEHIAVYCQSQRVQVELLQQGLGLALLPDYVGDALPNVARAFPEHLPPMVLDVWLVCHRELRTSRPIRQVFDALVAHFTERPSN